MAERGLIALLSRFCALSPGERRLALEATLALGLAASAIALFRFRRIAAIAGRARGNEIDGAQAARLVGQVRWAVAGCARRVPWRSKCFEQGLAAQWMLSRRRVAATLYFGLAKRDGSALMAHVWVRAGRLDVIGCENSADFSELARFPAGP